MWQENVPLEVLDAHASAAEDGEEPARADGFVVGVGDPSKETSPYESAKGSGRGERPLPEIRGRQIGAGEAECPSRSQHSSDLMKGRFRVLDVLEHLGARDEVELAVCKGKLFGKLALFSSEPKCAQAQMRYTPHMHVRGKSAFYTAD